VNPDFDQAGPKEGRYCSRLETRKVLSLLRDALKCLEKINATTSSGMMALIQAGRTLGPPRQVREAL